MRVALVYDRVNKIGGAERVLLSLHKIFPQAPLYTSVYDPKGAPWAKVFPKVIPSFLQKFPFAKNNHEAYFWLMPLAFESFNFDEYDLVITVTSEAAKGIITKPKTKHICYCLSTNRYLWQSHDDYFKNPLFRFLTSGLVKRLQIWDKIAAQRPDYMIAISKCVAERIKKYYKRDVEIIYPPVYLLEAACYEFSHSASHGQLDSSALARSHNTGEDNGISTELSKIVIQRPSDDYFLIVSRLVPYKRIDIAVEAFNKLGLPLKIVGSGSEENKLKEKALKNIEFLGQNLTDRELISYYQKCRALILPGVEDFGLVVVEAQMCGKPVIVYKEGGALEAILEGETGEFFSPQTAEALIKSVQKFCETAKLDEKYKIGICTENAAKFSEKVFQEKFKNFMEEHIE